MMLDTVGRPCCMRNPQRRHASDSLASEVQGAGGLVISPDAADRLGMRTYGEVHVSGVAGCVPSSFRRAEELRVGPLTIRNPDFMQMGLDGLVTGAPGPVIGILG